MHRKIIVVLVGFLVLAFGAIGFHYIKLARAFQPRPVPAALLAAEDALAMPGLLALFHFDVDYAIRAERAYYGAEDKGALPEPLTGDDSFLKILQNSGLDAREMVDQALLGLGDFEGLGAVGILLGRFPVDRLTEIFEQAYLIEHDFVGPYPIIRVTRENRDSCQATRPFVVHLAQNRIVAASQASLIPVIMERLDRAVPAERGLADWRAFREGKVASMAFIASPVEAIDAVEQSFLKAIAEAMKEQASPIRSVYTGLNLQTLPPTIGLAGWVEADDPAWPLDRLAEVRSWRSDVVRNAGTSVPSLVRLYDRLDVEADGPMLRFGLDLDESFSTDAGLVLAELIGVVFSNLGFDSKPSSAQSGQPAEEIVSPDRVPLLGVNRSHDGLEPFGEEFGGAVAWQAEAGPFGLRIKSLQINQEDPEVIEIEVEARSSEIPKVTLYDDYSRRHDAPAELVVTRVLGRDGHNLLRAEPCGQDRNDKAAELRPSTVTRRLDGESIQLPVLTGTKTVRLRPGVLLEDVVSLEGYLRLTLPTGLETHRLSAAAAGDLFENRDLRIQFRKSEPRGLTYEMSGNQGRLIEVRALNPAGDYLAVAVRSRSSRLFGLGSREEKSFKGEPAEVELLIARKEAVRDYPFTIEPMPPPFPENTPSPSDREPTWAEAMLLKTFTGLIEQAVMGEHCQDETQGTAVGPFRLCLARLQKWGDGFNGQFTIQAPNDERLAEHLSALEFVVDSVTLQDAADRSLRQVAADPLLSRVFVSGLRGYGDGDLEAWERFWGPFAANEEIGDEAPVGLRGRLSVRMPRELSEPLSLDITSLGRTAASPDGAQARLTGYKFRLHGHVVVEYQGPRADLVEIVQRSADGTVLGTANPSIEATDAPDTWKLEMSVSDRAATLDFVLAADQHRRDYPFDLVTPE